MIERPIINVDNNVITISSYINSVGEMVLNKDEATLLYMELHKIIFENACAGGKE